jgi:hypothetical protein
MTTTPPDEDIVIIASSAAASFSINTVPTSTIQSDINSNCTATTSITATSTICDVFTQPCIESCKISSQERQNVVWEQQKQQQQSNLNDPPKHNRCELAEVCVNSCAAYGRVCPCAARIAAHAACQSIRSLLQDSQVFTEPTNSFTNTVLSKSNEDKHVTTITTADAIEYNNQHKITIDKNRDFPYLDSNDIIINEKLGGGGFCYVNACTIRKRHNKSREMDKNLNKKQSDDESEPHEEDGQKCAIKYLKKTSMVDLHHFKHGASDLVVEAL